MSGPLSASLSVTANAIVTRSFITITMLAVNSGPNTITDLAFDSPLPSGYSYQSGLPGVTYSAGVVRYNVASLANGNSALFSYSVKSSSLGVATSVVNVEYNVGATTYVDSQSANTTVYPDLVITVGAPSTVARGSSFDYVFTATNPVGNPAFTDVKIRDPKSGWASALPLASATNSPTQPFDSVSLTTFFIAQKASLSGGDAASASLTVNVPPSQAVGNYGNFYSIAYTAFGLVYGYDAFLPLVQVV